MSSMPIPMPAPAPAPAAGAPNPFAAAPAAPPAAGGFQQSSLPDWGPKPEWAVSSNPADFGKGGSLFGDQANLECVHAEFTLNPPPGYTAPNTVFALLQLRDLSDPTGQTIVPQWWSCGNSADMLPSADGGEWLLPQTEKGKHINEGTNYGLLMATLKQKSYPEHLLAYGNIKNIFAGPRGNLMFKTIRVIPEGRQGLKGGKPKQDAAGRDRDPIGTLVCDQIIKFPWEASPRVAVAQRPSQAAAPQYVPPSQPAAPPAPPQQQQAYAPPPPQAAPMAPPAPAPAAAPPMAPPQPPQAPAPSGLASITDPQQIAQLAVQTIAGVVDASNGAGMDIPSARLSVFRALTSTYDVNTVNQVASVADNIQWLSQVGFRHDATTNRIHRA